MKRIGLVATLATLVVSPPVARSARPVSVPLVTLSWRIHDGEVIAWQSQHRYRSIDAMKLRIDGKLPHEERIGNCGGYYSRRGVVVRFAVCGAKRARLRIRITSVRARAGRVRIQYLATR